MLKRKPCQTILIRLIAIFSLTVLNFSSINIANAIYNGSSAIGDIRVLALIKGKDNLRSGCSASLINPQVVISAAHCLGNFGIKYTSEIFDPTDLWVAMPGSDLNVDDTATRVRVLRALVTKGYENTYEPEKGNIPTQKDDIAFYLLEKPIVPNYKIEIASQEEVKSIKENRGLIIHIGYGLQNINQQDGRPYLIYLRAFTAAASRSPNHPALESNTIASEETGDKALCPGDSGSPWYAGVDGKEKLVAVTVAASGCKGPGSGRGGTFGTVINPYLYLLENHWSEYLKELPKLKELNLSKVNYSLPLIQRFGGCDAYESATLQIQKFEEWVDFLPAQGWARVISCPPTNPYQPWVRADIESGTLIRWKIYSPGNWTVYTDPYRYIKPPAIVPSPANKSSKASRNIKTIVCVKNQQKRVIKLKLAKCPSGFKKVST